MLISGGLAGLAGAVELTGLSPHRLDQSAPGYGYTAIAVALLGRSAPDWGHFFGVVVRHFASRVGDDEVGGAGSDETNVGDSSHSVAPRVGF